MLLQIAGDSGCDATHRGCPLGSEACMAPLQTGTRHLSHRLF